MRNKSVMLLASLVFGMAASSATAGPIVPSLAYVPQATSANYVTTAPLMDTAAIFKPSMDVISSMPKAMDSTNLVGNLALAYQSGELNTASIEQTGTRNIGIIQQIGYMNAASITQTGTGHNAFISQQGRNNVAVIRQR
ncbi:hypothetical protein [Agrobacterium tumefaciens]|uniref:hypothetical protein n=1 Tax=Agrobacterium tumefaciens TaxID=358 RepID=UPI00287C4DC9|nr:hypothetical protein [Agrobacterium tumefaciens]MDS7594911.1 hypothetical protein [Agrobacterium tumefaciens]